MTNTCLAPAVRYLLCPKKIYTLTDCITLFRVFLPKQNSIDYDGKINLDPKLNKNSKLDNFQTQPGSSGRYQKVEPFRELSPTGIEISDSRLIYIFDIFFSSPGTNENQTKIRLDQKFLLDVNLLACSKYKTQIV